MYVPSTRKIISSCDVVFDESFSSALDYMSQIDPEAMVMDTAVMYTPCPTSSREKTIDIITFTHFKDGNVITKTRNDVESSDESNDESIMTMDSSDESDHCLI